MEGREWMGGRMGGDGGVCVRVCVNGRLSEAWARGPSRERGTKGPPVTQRWKLFVG